MAPESRRDIFQAIADPTRRQIIDVLSERPMNLKAIAEYFDISRPAISQQIKILNECGLVEISKKGRETLCTIKGSELKKISDWLGRYKNTWEDRIDSFEAHLQKLKSGKNKKYGKSK